MNNEKLRAGVLLHITSLPSVYGVGDLGRTAYEFVDFLAKAKQSLWQILPLNPPDFTFSPYQSSSAFANNLMLISPEELVRMGLLSEEEATPDKPIEDFVQAREFKEQCLRRAYANFKINDEYVIFCKRQAFWLEDYALFMTLKDNFGGIKWNDWPHKLSMREKNTLAEYLFKLGNKLDYYKFVQYIFKKQWLKLKCYANGLGVKIIGDIPIFIAFDSADVWAHQNMFALDQYGDPQTVAGVPPDYFSATGQLWGNPHYSWEEMAKNDYEWWRGRITNTLKLVDIVRIDHFRGFAGYWAVPFGEKTAVKGQWLSGPGEKFFAVLRSYFGKLPFIAEDLGVITEDVLSIKRQFALPGMKILQFDLDVREQGVSFEAAADTVVYTGTHDNNTTLGWYHEELGSRRPLLQRAFGTKDSDAIVWKLIETAYATQAGAVIVPMQDFLVLDSDARMNLPGTVRKSNWQWRMDEGALTLQLAEKIKELTEKYNRG